MSDHIGGHVRFTSHQSADKATRKTISRTVCLALLLNLVKVELTIILARVVLVILIVLLTGENWIVLY